MTGDRRDPANRRPGQALLPPSIVEFEGPLVFLAGPIQGAPDWQAQAIAWFGEHAGDLAVASPRRDYAPGEFEYNAQVDWESHYLRRAAVHGVVLFWLAREISTTPGRAYAQTTRFELGEWKVRHERDGVALVVGIEEGYSGERYIRRRLAQDCAGVKILTTLEETCRAARDACRRLDG